MTSYIIQVLTGCCKSLDFSKRKFQKGLDLGIPYLSSAAQKKEMLVLYASCVYMYSSKERPVGIKLQLSWFHLLTLLCMRIYDLRLQHIAW